MKFKDNVVITGKCINNFKSVLIEFQRQCYDLLGIHNYKCTITSANDSIHSTNSEHYKNNALDLRIKDLILDTGYRKQLFEAVIFVLGYLHPDFVFIAHIYDGKNHLHIQKGFNNIKDPDSGTGDNKNIFIR